MVDIVKHTATVLSSLNAQIEQSYSDTNVTFPLIVIQVISDIGETARDGAEVVTRLAVQIDAYTLDKDDTFNLSAEIDRLLTPCGYKRTNAFPVNEGEIERYQMTYTVNVDYQNKTIL